MKNELCEQECELIKVDKKKYHYLKSKIESKKKRNRRAKEKNE